MFAVADDLGITPGQVLATFRYDAPYLFLGSAFIAVGLISAAFSAVRRKADTLLIYFALFATVYGLRLWIQAEIVKLIFDDSVFYLRFREGINYIVPVPAMLFLNATGGLTRLGKSAGYLLVVVGSILAIATFALGRLIPGDPCKAMLGERADAQICADFAVRSTARLPPAPVTFSTTTGLPQEALSFSASTRADMSGATPGEKPTRMRTGCSG